MADLAYVRGTSYSMDFNYTPAAGNADGATVLFTVKTEIDDDITDLENDIMTPKNITLVDNACTITIEPGDVSMDHPKARNYVWDTKVIDEDGKIFPCVSGKFGLNVTATNRITA